MAKINPLPWGSGSHLRERWNPSPLLSWFKAVKYLPAHLQLFHSTVTPCTTTARRQNKCLTGHQRRTLQWVSCTKPFVSMHSPLKQLVLWPQKTGKKLELAAHSNCHFSTGAGTSLGSYGLMHLLTYSSRVQAVHNSAFIKCWQNLLNVINKTLERSLGQWGQFHRNTLFPPHFAHQILNCDFPAHAQLDWIITCIYLYN